MGESGSPPGAFSGATGWAKTGTVAGLVSTFLATATFVISFIAAGGNDGKGTEASLGQPVPPSWSAPPTASPTESATASPTPPPSEPSPKKEPTEPSKPRSAPEEEPPEPPKDVPEEDDALVIGTPVSIENSAYHVIDLYGGGSGYGTMIGAWWSDNDTTSQEWELVEKGDGHLIEAVREKGVLGYGEEGTVLVAEGGAETVWLFKESSEYPGFYSIHSKVTDRCITDNDFERGLDPLMGRMLSVEFCGVSPSGAQLWHIGDLDDAGCRGGGKRLDSPLGRVCAES